MKTKTIFQDHNNATLRKLLTSKPITPFQEKGIKTKKGSWIETITQTIIGLGISFLIQVVLYPVMEIPVTLDQNIIITAVFFIASLIRGYVVRRIFNRA